MTPESVSLVVEDMVANNLLDKEQGIYRPTTKGRDFIESSRVYSNMAPTSLETALIDADTGQHIASVASVAHQDGGVRVAGKSYEILRTDHQGRLLVRAGGEFISSPKYHASSLPYAFDIGVCLARLFEIAPGLIVCLRVGDRLAVFTWLGQLLNQTLRAGLQATSVEASAEPLFLLTTHTSSEAVIPSLRLSVANIRQRNPMGALAVERIADVGPYFEHLSSAVQVHSREDWLDQHFLDAWSQSLTTAEEIEVHSALGQQLASFI